jgi:hypothetical protein
MPARLGDRDPGPVNGPVTDGAYKVPVIGKPGLDVKLLVIAISPLLLFKLKS